MIEILPKLCKFEWNTKICMRATPTVQNRVSIACYFCTVQTNQQTPPPLCTEMILLAEIQI